MGCPPIFLRWVLKSLNMGAGNACGGGRMLIGAVCGGMVTALIVAVFNCELRQCMHDLITHDRQSPRSQKTWSGHRGRRATCCPPQAAWRAPAIVVGNDPKLKHMRHTSTGDSSSASNRSSFSKSVKLGSMPCESRQYKQRACHARPNNNGVGNNVVERFCVCVRYAGHFVLC